MKCSLCSKDFIPGVEEQDTMKSIQLLRKQMVQVLQNGEDLRVVRDGYPLIS